MCPWMFDRITQMCRCDVQGDIVVELTWVDGLGNIHTDSRASEAGRALVGGLGVAGVVTELLLQLEPASKTVISTWFKKRDSGLYQDVQQMLKVSQGAIHCCRQQTALPC